MLAALEILSSAPQPKAVQLEEIFSFHLDQVWWRSEEVSQSYEVREKSNLKANFAKSKQCRSGNFPYVGDVIDMRSTSHDELLFFSFPTIPGLSKSVE